MLTQDQINQKWSEIKGGVRNLWGEITDDELESTHGNISAISGIVHRKYGETREQIKEKMHKLMSSFDNETDKHHLDAEASYERNPTGERTSSESQLQDKESELRNRRSTQKDFGDKSYAASRESLDHAKGSTSNSYQNPNREQIGEDLRP